MRTTVMTWNVNSVRARLDRLLALLQRHQPDVLCLQELKVADADFPFGPVGELGYRAVVYGQKTYNGVAILSKEEAREVEVGLDDGVEDPQARLISARFPGLRVVSVYVPNGATVGSEKWAYKLEWLARLRSWLDRRRVPGEPLAVCGDFNVAPEERDVHDPRAWEETVLFHPQARAALADVLAFGLVDTYRLHHPEGGRYSWWDYRMLAFPKDDGLRIDHVFATPPLAARCTGAEIDRAERKGKLPSDHAPVIATFDLP
ncbi:exodeoxyribonuclease III [Myxococcota bacterium]|nr:exodeoxyribonuclease III [Myxococcota bacterium]